MGDSPVPTVLVTGFGPFRNHTENSSWITVQELSKLNITDYNLIIKELPVVYETVTEVVPLLWKEFHPKLTVHCGMCEMRRYLSVEKMARKTGYFHCDINGQIPMCNICCKDGPEMLCTSVDLSKVIDDVSSSCSCVKTEVSEDAGLYLCEFTYYTSLNINKNTIFVHVPPIDQPYSASEMAKALANVISSSLKHINS